MRRLLRPDSYFQRAPRARSLTGAARRRPIWLHFDSDSFENEFVAISGAHALLHMLSEYGVRYIFGNPGTTELPLCDAIANQQAIQYVLGLQEIPVMSMADGYAMAGRRLGVVNLHVSCGLGNAMGMLYNAFREGTPLLVTAGQQDRRIAFEEPILWGDMVAVARPWTKWAYEVERLDELPRAIRRAVQIALTPPAGPVFLSLPMDLQMELGELDLTVSPRLDCRVRPPVQALLQAADALRSAKNPAILSGSRVAEAEACESVANLAERIGAPVFGEPGHAAGRQGFSARHPLYAQTVPHWSPEIRQRLAEFDVLFVVGMDLFRLYVFQEPSRAVPEHVRIVHCDESPYQIGKNYPTEVGVVGDVRTAVDEIDALLDRQMSKTEISAAQVRRQRWTEKHAADRTAMCERIDRESDHRPVKPTVLMDALARVLPENVAVVEEAVTTTNTTFQRLGALPNTAGYFAHRGWSLGWGLGCALGVKLAWPQRPVLALLGDGASLYGIQGLWSAARYQLGVRFVICNNSQYQILKAGARGLGLPNAQAGRFVGMDLTGPDVNFVSLAQSFGVSAERCTEPRQLAERLADEWNLPGPKLYEIAVEQGLTGPG